MYRVIAMNSVAVIALSALGCRPGGRDFQPHPVRGEVRYRGGTVAGATVTFHPMGGLPPSRTVVATTDDEGRFKLTYSKPGDGAPAGEYAVTIVLREKRLDGDELVRNGRNLLPMKYSDPDTSDLWAIIQPKDNELPPFILTE